MAETIRRRIVRQDALIDDRLEPAWDRLHRATMRAQFRAARHAAMPGEARLGEARLARELRVPIDAVRAALAARYCGEGWARLEAASPTLRPVGVLRGDLARESATAGFIVRHLQRLAGARPERAAEVA